MPNTPENTISPEMREIIKEALDLQRYEEIEKTRQYIDRARTSISVISDVDKIIEQLQKHKNKIALVEEVYRLFIKD